MKSVQAIEVALCIFGVSKKEISRASFYFCLHILYFVAISLFLVSAIEFLFTNIGDKVRAIGCVYVIGATLCYFSQAIIYRTKKYKILAFFEDLQQEGN